jgi:hypothetical protein
MEVLILIIGLMVAEPLTSQNYNKIVVDNITAWIPGKKILFGGCLIKSFDSQGLGNLSDAVVPQWDLTVKKILVKYMGIKTVIPGHGDTGGIELLTHTIELVENEKNKQFLELAPASTGSF